MARFARTGDLTSDIVRAMRGLVLCLGVTLAACGDPTGTSCDAGTHLDNGACIEDTTCMAGTCSGHGTCAVVNGATACTCDTEYTGPNCGACAAGFQDHGAMGTCMPACATQCGAFGLCDDSTGAIACTYTAGTTGDRCEACTPPTATIVNDTFGGRGEHHTLDITPGAIVVAPLPSPGATGGGEISFGQIAGMPSAGSQKFTLAFSRCPGELTWASEQFEGNAKPCVLETTSVTGGTIRWTEAGAQTATTCLLPPGSGPWYANLKVGFALSIETCDDAGPCKIDWQWN